MAKYETRLNGDFNVIIDSIDRGILQGSISASCEDTSDFTCNGVRCAVRVYERFSVVGQNRVSLNITLVGFGSDIYLSAISSGGSQAVLFKMNTFGEEAFLNGVRDIVRDYVAW